MMTATESPKKYARMICDHLKALPDKFAEDPKSVQKALGLSDDQFKKGLDLCVAKKIIVLESAPVKAVEKAPAVKPADKAPEKNAASPFGDSWDDFTGSVFKADDGEEYGSKKKTTAEVPAVAAFG